MHKWLIDNSHLLFSSSPCVPDDQQQTDGFNYPDEDVMWIGCCSTSNDAGSMNPMSSIDNPDMNEPMPTIAPVFSPICLITFFIKILQERIFVFQILFYGLLIT